MRIKLGWLFLGLFFLIPLLSTAHVPDQSYIFLRIYEEEGIKGRFEINTREINKLYGTDFRNGVTMDEIAPYIDRLRTYLYNHSGFSSVEGKHEIIFEDVGIFPGTLGDFIQFFFTLENTKEIPDELNVEYSVLFEEDSGHRGFLITEYNWKAGVLNEEANISLEFAPDRTRATLDLTDSSIWIGLGTMIKQGIWHIWIGIDHILFLLALILPSVVRRRKKDEVGKKDRIGNWQPVQHFKPAFWYVVKIITFFTIAHTITLSLASLKIINLPSQLVESIIALSIGLAAYHNIVPIFKGRDWVIAFVFGLFHGFGFASVLGDLGLSGEFLTLSLLGFNLGVEIGQIVIIALIFPILFLIRKSKAYPKILVYGSVLLIIISLYWVVERAFDIDLKLDNYIKGFLYELAVSLGLA